MDFEKLAVFRLEQGGHASPEEGLCAMEAVAWLEGLEHSDRPPCTCPVIAEFVMDVNDKSLHEQRQRLIAYLPRLVGTVSPAHARERAELLVSLYESHAPDDQLREWIDLARQELDGGDYAEAAWTATLSVESWCQQFDTALRALDAVLAIGPQSRGFSTDVDHRISTYRELVAS